MSWIDDAVARFGDSMRLDGVRLPEDGSVTFAFANTGTLHVERQGEDVMLCLERRHPYIAERMMRAALDACHWRHNRPFDMHVGLKDDDLVLVIRLRGREVTPSALEQAFDLLRETHDRLAG